MGSLVRPRYQVVTTCLFLLSLADSIFIFLPLIFLFCRVGVANFRQGLRFGLAITVKWTVASLQGCLLNEH